MPPACARCRPIGNAQFWTSDIRLAYGNGRVAADLRGHLPLRVGHRRCGPAEPVAAGGQPAAQARSSARWAPAVRPHPPRGRPDPAGAGSSTSSVADALDRLEPVLTGLDGGVVRPGATGPPSRFLTRVLHLRRRPPPVHRRAGPVRAVRPRRRPGRAPPPRRARRRRHHDRPRRAGVSPRCPSGPRRFVLVAAPGYLRRPAGRRPRTTWAGPWPVRHWVAYSAELPRTRRFWQAALGRPFAGQPATGRPRPAGRGRGRGPGPRGEPAPGLRLCRRPGLGRPGRGVPGRGPGPGRGLVRRHPRGRPGARSGGGVRRGALDVPGGA